MLKLLATSLAVLLTACGGGGGGASATTAEQLAQPSPAPVTGEVWTVEATAVLAPSQAWEFTTGSPQGSVLEPSVLFDSTTGTYRMWYSGGWEKCAMGTATSSDGVHWTKSPINPLIGQGKLGQAIACRNNVVKDQASGEVYIYFANSTGDRPGSIYVTHSPDGLTNLAPPQLLLAPGATDINLANSWIVLGADGKWRIFYDSMTAAGTWEAFSAVCDTPLGPCAKQPGPLKGLQVGRGSYGGGWVQMQSGRFNTYFLAGPNGAEAGHLPTYIYHACDAGMGTVTFGNHGNPLLSIPSGYDQHGDPFLIDGASMPDGKSRMWLDELHNPSGYSHIVMATHAGALPTCN